MEIGKQFVVQVRNESILALIFIECELVMYIGGFFGIIVRNLWLDCASSYHIMQSYVYKGV